MIYGFIFASLIALGQRFRLYDDTSKGGLWSRAVTVPVALLSLAGLGGYFAFAWNCSGKVECNEIHPYVAFIPVSGKKLYDTNQSCHGNVFVAN